jgi:hypothetical protein
LPADCNASSAPLVGQRPTAIFISGSCRSRRDASRIRHEMFEMGDGAGLGRSLWASSPPVDDGHPQSAAAGHEIPRLRNVLMALSVGAFGQ